MLRFRPIQTIEAVGVDTLDLYHTPFPADFDNARHAWAILSLLVKRLRQAWPDVHIIFRGDSGFCRHQMLNWCDRHNVSYIVEMAKNSRLNDLAESWILEAAVGFLCSQEKQRLFGDFFYAANTWKYERRVNWKMKWA